MAIVTYFQFNVLTQPDPQNPQNTLIKVEPGPHALFSGGIMMDVSISLDVLTETTLKSTNRPVPAPIIAKALVDTGCTITSIDKTLVSNLDLITRGYAQTHTANGVVSVSQHLVSIGFPGTNLMNRPVQTVQSIDLSGQPFSVLIGRDLMALWSITYNGTTGFVCIAD